MALAAVAMSNVGCGSGEKEAKVSELRLTDELAFPTKGDQMVTLEEIPDGSYGLKRIETYTHSRGFNRVLYRLELAKPGTPDRKKDSFELRAKWEDDRMQGFVSMSGAIPLKATVEDGVLDLRQYKLLKMEATAGEVPSYSFEKTPGGLTDRGQYSIVFSDLATRNGFVYSAAGLKGSIELNKKELILHTYSKSGDYSVVTRFVFVRL